MRYQFGDVVLVPFPFTDQSTTKQRPGVIVSSAGYHDARRDLILMAVASQVRGAGAFGELVVQDWQAAKRRTARRSRAAHNFPALCLSARP
ncbi:MAG TPA: type II toxin-antitoxin system PemK/MazF family toxin [Gammaproteobacteria bacterium]|nr:type II toxin-antitoxin system PemK/MazF family toxin [Gammaproteobacteria bacterium]